MFGPYEISYEGRRYFGNVSLREFHIFGYDSNYYLLDVGSMAAHKITQRLAAMIPRVASTSGCLVPESDMRELRKFDLIASKELTPPETLPGGGSGEAGRKAEPAVVYLFLLLAQECNLRCVYCFAGGGKYAGKGMMSEETAFLAVDWLIANSKSEEKVHICFFGGEPLLNFPLAQKVVSYAREKTAGNGKQVTFSITSNGTLLTDEMISFFKKEKIGLLISLDGPPEYQNRQRPFKDGSGSYDKVLANIQKLRAVFPNLTGRATVYGDADPFRIEEALEQAGFTTCILVKALPTLLNAPPAVMRPDGLREQTLQRLLTFNRKEIDQLLATIRERKINKDCPPRLLSHVVGLDSRKKRYYSCGIGKMVAVISVTGDIYPSPCFAGQEEMRMGNIADYHVETFNDYYRAVVDNLPECRGCWARYYCGGGCFYNNKAHTGDIHRPEALSCMETKAMFEGLIHVYCQLDDEEKRYVKDIVKD